MLGTVTVLRRYPVKSILVLRVIARTPRCAIPTLAHGDLPRDTEALRVVASAIRSAWPCDTQR